MTRRKTRNKINLCSGPGKLCAAMGITRENYGEDLCGEKLFILDDDTRDFCVKTSPRVNIDYAAEYKSLLWRYFVEGNVYVSKVK